MSKSVIAIGIILSTCLVPVIIGVAVAQAPAFRVESFIPERFTDLEWRLNGDLELKGNRDDRKNWSLLMPYESIRGISSSKSDYDNQGFNVGSAVEYRYETVPRFLLSSSSLAIRYFHWKENINELNPLYPPYTTKVVNEEDGNDYTIYLSEYLDAGRYVKSNLFLSCMLQSYMIYEKRPGTDFHRYSYYSGYMDGYIYEQTDIPSGTDRSDSKDYYLSFTVLPGFGRTYEGRFASTAMYMIDELKKGNHIEREPTFDEMLQLSDLIYQYRLKHAIDSRLHRIEALTAIVNYLKDKGIVGDLDPDGQIILQDVWSYFPNKPRRFGYRARIGLGFEWDYSSEQYSREFKSYRFFAQDDPNNDILIPDTVVNRTDAYHNYDHEKIETRNPFINLILEYFRPFNYRWQLDLTAQARYYFEAQYTRHWEDNSYAPYVDLRYLKQTINFENTYDLSLSASASCFLDSRTILRFYGDCLFAHFDGQVTDSSVREVGYYHSDITRHYDYYDHETWFLSLGALITYRISIPTELRIRVDYDFDSWADVILPRFPLSTSGYQVIEYDNNRYDISVSVIHYLF
jgi:hypothetical protein